LLATIHSTLMHLRTADIEPTEKFIYFAFAKAISSDKLLQIIEQQPTPAESFIENIPSDDNVQIIDNPLLSENNQWKVADLCLCPYSDGLLYKATIIDIQSSSCTVPFDDYGNIEIHPLTYLQIWTEEEQQQQEALSSIDEHDILPRPPFPVLNSNDDNISLTLMSWDLAGYHTGLYQGIRDKKNLENEIFIYN
jgi:hypothetical protein